MEKRSSESDIFEIHQLIQDIQSQLLLLKQKIDILEPFDEQGQARVKAEEVGSEGGGRQGTIVEGVFDGQNMIGPDGKMYTIPANYASKSKLVEGDIMKLTIHKDGSFVYKQIGPVERIRHKATLVRDDETGSYRAVVSRGHSYRLLTASVTYYKGEPQDDVMILVPRDMETTWAAVENIVKKGEMTEEEYTEMYRNMDDEGIENGHSLLPSGDDTLLPSATFELPSEHGELSAEHGLFSSEQHELEGEKNTLSSETDEEREVTEETTDDSFDDGSKPFTPFSV